MILKPLGASREVTGSCHLVKVNGKTILLDCGAFQGKNSHVKNRARINELNPKNIDFVVNSHGHQDHIGWEPILYKNGCRAPIYSTSATIAIAKIGLIDSAKIQEEDAKRSKERTEPLYTKADVDKVIKHFARTVSYGEPIELAPGIRITFFDAGHILGSAFILLEVEENGREKKLIFSGDLGNGGKPIIRDPEIPPKADYVLEESTYGDRSHKPIEESIEELYSAINDTFERGGNFNIPIFAIEKSQDFLCLIREGMEKGILPSYTKVFLDSPMAIDVTKVFSNYPEYYNNETKELFDSGIDPFLPPNITFTRTVDQSKEINEVKRDAIILAGSGMMQGGRILHHMKHGLPKEENGFAFTSYAPHGSQARKIIDGANYIWLFKQKVPVRAKIYTIGGFSAHAGQNELLKWHEPIEPEKTFLVHGDTVPMETLASKLRAKSHVVEMPKKGDSFDL